MSHELSYYRRGATPIFASAVDQRFSYCVYAPRNFEPGRGSQHPVTVLVHSTDRDAQYVRDEFVDYAEQTGSILYAPIFPAGIDDPEDVDNYKFLEFRELRFDLLLIDMLDEFAATYGVDVSQFLLTGFSGGAHFTHRFTFLHPERVRAASVAAPGVVTLLDAVKQWPAGVAGTAERLGRAVDFEAVSSVPWHLVIGEDDREVWEIGIPPGSPWWIEGVNDLDSTRLVRLDALRRSLETNGARVEVDVVPGVSHDGQPLAAPTKRFFASVVQSGHRKAAD